MHWQQVAILWSRSTSSLHSRQFRRRAVFFSFAPTARRILDSCADGLGGLRKWLAALHCRYLSIGWRKRPVPQAPPQRLRISTEMLPGRDGISAFREEFARRIFKMDVVPLGDGKSRMDLTVLKLGPAAVGSCAGNAAEFVRDVRQVKDGVGDFLLCFLKNGPVRSLHAGQENSLDAGSAALYDHGQTSRVGSQHSAGVRNVMVPAAMLKALVPHPEDRAGHVVRPGPALHLLDNYLAALLALDKLPPPELAHLIGLHLVDLFAAAIGPTAEAAEIIAGRGLKAARLRAILAEIARHSGNPAFDIDRVAGRFGLSRRSVQVLLEESGKPFTEHLAERRLERAYAMLTDPRFSHRRIIDIAFAAGFGDVSHFNRLFRRRFGETPSSARTFGRAG